MDPRIITPGCQNSQEVINCCGNATGDQICGFVVCCRQTYRWEASLWLNARQIYLGGFATEEEAAHAYDLAALGCKGSNAETNFPLATYSAELSTELKDLSQV